VLLIEAAGCLRTYEKTASGHECTTLVMDKYSEVATHTAQIQTTTFPSILSRPHAAPVVRGILFLDHASGYGSAGSVSFVTSLDPGAEKFWKVMMVNDGVVSASASLVTLRILVAMMEMTSCLTGNARPLR